MQPPKEGTPVRIDRSLTRPMYCKCGCKAFLAITTFRFCPAIGNPTGQEIIIPEQGIMCTACRTIYNHPSELQNARERSPKQ